MSITYEEVEQLALNLSIKEQARLVERVASSVATQLRKETSPQPAQEHWGQRVLAILEQYPIEEWQAIEDPVEWLAQQRAEGSRKLDWNGE